MKQLEGLLIIIFIFFISRIKITVMMKQLLSFSLKIMSIKVILLGLSILTFNSPIILAQAKWRCGHPEIRTLRRVRKLEARLPKSRMLDIKHKSWNEGDQFVFMTHNYVSDEDQDTPATLREIGINCYIWVADDQWPPNGTRIGLAESTANLQLEKIANEFDTNIYPTDREYFGNEPDVDGDPRIHILLFDIIDGYTGTPPNDVYTAGYFDEADQKGQNNFDMFYMDVDPGIVTSLSFHGTLAHEFQHMIHYDMDSGHDEERWLEEGLADYAIPVCGYGLPTSHISGFSNNPDVTLIDEFNNGLDEYGAAFLFVEFMTELAQRNSPVIGEFTRSLVDEEDNGVNGINNVVPNFLPSEHDTFEKIFQSWVIANYLDSETGVYGYRYPGLDFSVLIRETALNANSNPYHIWTNQSVNAWAADYFLISPNQGFSFDTLLDFKGEIRGIDPRNDFNALQILVRKDGDLVGPPIPLEPNLLNDVNYAITLRSYDEIAIVVSGNDDGGNYEFSAAVNQILLTVSPQAITADGQSSATITAQLSDPDATNPVTFAITAGSESGQFVGQNPVTPVNGVAIITLQSTTTPGIVTIEASSPNISSSSTTVVAFSQPTEVSGTISSNTVWTLANSPYLVTGDITVMQGATLTIEPGVVVELNSSRDLFINGRLVADGLVNQRIIFTSSSASPTARSWGGIRFSYSPGDAASILNYCNIEYGGQGGYGNLDAPIVLDARANPQIMNSTLANNRYNGLNLITGTYSSDIRLDVVGLPYVLRGDLTISGGAVLTIAAGVLLKFASGADFYINGGLTAEGNATSPIVFTSLRDDTRAGDTTGDGSTEGSAGDWGGIWFGETVDDARTILRYCEIYFAGQGGYGNLDSPISLDARANPTITNAVLSDNRLNGLNLRTGTYSSDILLDVTVLPYMIRGDLTMASGATLTVRPAVMLKFDRSADFYINGGLLASGTAANHIVFSSLRDDSVAGDTNGDGITAGSAGDWGGIWFSETSDDSKSKLAFCDIFFSGQGGYGNLDAPIELDARANPQMSKILLSDNRLNGIDLKTGTYNSDIRLNVTGLPYMIRGDITVGSGATMLVDPGALLKFDRGSDFYIRGGFRAEGSQDAPIILTSMRDDNRGGDTNNDGATSGSPGNWGGIRFEASIQDGNTVMRYGEIYYGGQGGYGNNNSPIVLDARANPIIETVTLTDNRVNGVWLINQTYGVSIDLDIIDLPYILGGDLTVGASAHLTVHPGTLFKMGRSTDFFVDGTLRVIGEQSRPVVFTSFNDDSHGSDTDGTGATSGVPGDWGGIRFRDASNDAASFIEYAEFHFAGQGGYGNNGSPLVFEDASPRIEHVLISNTKSHGVHCANVASPDLGGGQLGGVGGNSFIGFLNNENKYAIFNDGSADIYAKFNNWESSKPELIDQMIYDVKDRSGRGQVFYQPIGGVVSVVQLTGATVTPFPAEVGAPLTFSGRFLVNGQPKQVAVGMEDPVTQLSRMLPVQSDGSFTFTTSAVPHVDTYVFKFGALGSLFETLVIPTREPSSAIKIPLLSAKLAFELGKLGRPLGIDSPINILGEKLELSGATEAKKDELFSEVLIVNREFSKQFSNNLAHLYLTNGESLISEGVSSLAATLYTGVPSYEGILVDVAAKVTEAAAVSLIQTLLNQKGQYKPEYGRFLQKRNIILALVAMQARRGIGATEVATIQALLDNNEVDEITIQEIEKRFDGEVMSLIIQVLSKLGDRFGIVLAEHGTGNMISVIGRSPIDLVVTDPEGLVVSKDSSQIAKGNYIEADTDGDEELEDQIIIFDAKSGNYSVMVVPDSTGSPSDTYSLYFVADGDTTSLAQNEEIQNIPSEPYSVNYSVPTSVSTPLQSIPEDFALFQNYPNPFNPTTTIRYQLPKTAHVTLTIYNVRGQEVRTLVDEEKLAGAYPVQWNGRDSTGSLVASGVYLYRLTAGGVVGSRKLVLMR